MSGYRKYTAAERINSIKHKEIKEAWKNSGNQRYI